MTNVVPLRPRTARTADPDAGARDLVADLALVMAQLREASAQAAGLDGPPLAVERTVQHLLDALSAVERAAAEAAPGA